MSELEYCAFCDGGYAHSGICDKCTTEIGQTGKELADKDKQLAEARAEVERKDRLIEQMQGALTKLIGTLEVMSVMPETLGKYPVLAIDAPELEQARAALAAERSECL
jgi:hypothetical protein